MTRDQIEDIYELTPLQQGMLLRSVQDPREGLYVLQLRLELVGEVDSQALAAAWQDVVQRHAVLRTVFSWRSLDKPVQIVLRRAEIPFEIGSGECTQELLARDRSRGFDLEVAPLARVQLLRQAPGRYVLLWTFHHLILDGWSASRVLGDVLRAYEGRRRGAAPESPPPPPFRRYLAWLQNRDSLADLAFWRRELAGFTQPTPLPAPPPRRLEGAAEASHGSRRLALEPQLATAVFTFARDHGLTPATLLQGAWAVLLARHAAAEDVCFGVTVAGRPADLAGAEAMVGLLIQTLPLRLRVPPAAPLLPWLREVQLRQAEGREHGALPLVELKRTSAVAARDPLFESLLVFESYPMDATRAAAPAGLELGEPRLLERIEYPLNLLVVPRGGGLALEMLFDQRRIEEGDAAALLERLAALLADMVERPAARLGDLSLGASPAAEVGTLAEAGPDSELTKGRIEALVAAAARRVPQSPAVEGLLAGEAVAWSYDELCRRAAAVARHLRSAGAGPETTVALALERGPALPATLLGVLAAGAAYVPLDPAQPPLRQQVVLADSGARLLITEAAVSGRLPPLPDGMRVLRLEEGLLEPLPGAFEAFPEVTDGGHGLAYVLYTSGSTGRPKGVAVAHRSAVAFLRAMAARPGLAPDDALVAVTTVTFDISLLELFLPLVVGARVVIAGSGESGDGAGLARRLATSAATALQATPVTWRLLLAADWKPPARFKALCGGEAMPPDLARDLLQRGVELWNLYGPTETTVWSAVRRIEAADAAFPVPVGEAIPGTRLAVLDPRLRPVPAGGLGELHIAGAGLARGYRGLPARTAAAFVPDPLAISGPGSRLYRTGDLARQRRDGVFEVLGRRDQQVKLRGFRVEPGEIESVMAEHPAVRQAAVVVHEGLAEDAGGGPRLVAYVVAAAGEHADQELEPAARSRLIGGLQKHLGTRLPAYMVPALFEVVSALPQTSSGKVDRRALAGRPLPAAASAGVTAPRGPLEETVAEVWADVLGVEKVGAEADFFALGGHSLSALQVVSRLRRVLGVELEVQDLFDAPQVAALAARLGVLLTGTDPEAAEKEPAAIEPLPAGAAAPLSSSQLRQWFLDQLEPGLPAYNLPMALRLRGRLDRGALERALGEVVRRHEVMRTVYPVVDGEPHAIVEPAAPVTLVVHDLRRAAPETVDAEARRVAADEMTWRFDLARGPVLRCALIALEDEHHVLCVTLHHIAGDGWSIGLLLRETLRLYSAGTEGDGESPLAALPIQYGDYAAWQRRRLETPEMAAHLEWWRGHLGDGSPPLELATDRPRPAVQTFRGARVPLALDAELSEALAALGRRRGATTFMLLLAGFDALLLRLTGQTDLTVGTFVANRDRPELERLIGFFVNTLPLRVDLAGGPGTGTLPGFAETLSRVRQAALGAYQHQALPLERLLEDVAPERDLGRTPLFQVMLVVQNLPLAELEALELPELRLEVLEFTGLGRSNFDLTLWVTGLQGGLRGALEYNRDLFEAATAERFLRHFETLLRAAVSHPERPLDELPLLAEAERRQVLYDWPAGTAWPVLPLTVPELLRETVPRRAGEPAVLQQVAPQEMSEHGGLATHVWTFAQLARRVDALAGHLNGLRLAPEERVAVCLDRSPEAVAALLAVLEAGGAYVPLDPTTPSDRLRWILDDSGARCVLTSRRLVAELGELSRLPVIAVDEVLASLDVEVAAGGAPFELPPRKPVAWENAAYILYTSGTTGRPKGVVITHGNLANYAQAVVADYGFGPGDRLLQFAALSFDNSGEEIYGALVGGSVLVLRHEEMTASPEAFLDACGRLGITVLNLPTAFWSEVVTALAREEAPASLPATVRLVIVGGETMQPEQLMAWRRSVAPEVRIFNTYGPTESTIGITAWPAGEVAAEAAGVSTGGERFSLEGGDGGLHSVPLGRPMANARLFVADVWGRPCPVGVPGGLCVGGPGVARGYLGRPALTAERFVPDPWGTEAGSRLYVTGDRVRWLATGDLAFLGRLDHQVKVRGFRIELAEVEAVLTSLPGVRGAVVRLRRDAAGNARLAAWVAALEPGRSTTAAEIVRELRRQLGERLPSYMVPDAFVVLEALPRLPSGKLHVAALPEPQVDRDLLETAYVAPRNEVEELVAELFADLLGVPQVGAFDDFFALGGHSLLATRLVSRLRTTFEVEVPVRLLFEAPTVARLALAIEEKLIEDLEELSDEEVDVLA